MDNGIQKNSLTLLIIIFAIVILLTIIILNSNINTKQLKSSEIFEAQELLLRNIKDEIPRQKPMRMKDIGFTYSQHFNKAKRLISEKKEGEAEDILRTILIFRPNDLKTLSLLGGIFYYSGRYKKAEDIFKKQIAIDPNSHLAYNRLASTFAKQKKFDDAIKIDSQALAINPSSPEVHINLAGMYSITNKKERALQHLIKAYESFGYAILPLTADSAFDNIRSTPEFQSIISKAKKELPSHENSTLLNSKEKTLYPSDKTKVQKINK